MKQFINVLLISFLFSLGAFGQNRSDYFKTLPPSERDCPQWVQLMYSEDPNVLEVDFQYYQFYQEFPFEKTIHTQNYRHWRRTVENWLDAEGYIRRSKLPEPPQGQETHNLLPWVPVGPFETYNESSQGNFPVSWQVNVYSFDQSISNPDILFAGTEAGGLFKSTNKGISWELVGADENILTVQDVKVSPTDPNIVFCASNDIIYRSTDGGLGWEEVYTVGSGIYQLEIHPTDPQTIFCASQVGLLRSLDGGTSWSSVWNGKVWDVKLQPSTPSNVYMLWSDPAEDRCEFYRSTDGGTTWVQQETGWYQPSSPANASDIGARIAVTPADPSRVYVGLLGQSKDGDNGWIGVYRSDDGGQSWVNPNLPDGGPYNNDSHQNLATINKDGTGFHQGFYNFGIAASHVNPDRLWVGTLSLNVTEDAGATWLRIGSYSSGANDIGWIHPDIQDLHVLGEDVWVCTDGGINYSTDELLTHESRKSGIYGSDFWGFGQGWNQDVLVGGRYHNGNSGYYENYGVGNVLRLGGAEAPTGYVNPLYERTVYFSDINSKVLPEEIDGPVPVLGSLGLYPNESYFVSYSSEIEFHPNYASHFYMGRDNKIWKSTNRGGLFEAIYTFPGEGRVLELEICRADPDRMYCVFQPGDYYWNDCTLYGSVDGGLSWEELSSLPTNDPFRLEISVNPEDPDELWVVSVNGDPGEVVFQSLTGGASWIDRSNPELMGDMRDVQYQAGSGGLVYVATTRGVYYWDPVSTEWLDYSEGLPYRTRALEMLPFYRDSKLRLSSGGRGVWEAPMAGDFTPIAQPMTGSDKTYCTRDTVLFDCHSFLNHTGASWAWTFSPEPQYVSDPTIRNPKVVFGAEGSYDVTLTIVDGSGQESTQMVPSMVTVENYCGLDAIPGMAMESINSGDYATTAPFNVTTNNFTLTAWVKPIGIQNEYTGIAINNGSAAGLNFKADNQLGYHWPGGAWWWDSGLYAPPGEWSYVALVVTPDSVTIYVNGEGSTHLETTDPVDLSTFNLGNYQGWGGRNYAGQLDEVCMWNRSLTQEEVRELRHLTRTEQDLIDPDLLAYYQFNEPEGAILDKAGISHAELRGGAGREISTGPFGGGVVARLAVNESGTLAFGNTGLSMLLDESQSLPNGDVVVSRIDLLPTAPPNQNPNAGAYWVVNNYGTNVNFEGLLGLTFVLPDGEWNPAIVDDPALLRLFLRSENGFINNWQEQCGAASVNSSAVFPKSFCAIESFYQFFLTSADPEIPLVGTMTNLSDLEEQPAIKLYPNPVLAGDQLVIDNAENSSLRLRMYDSNGRIQLDQLVQAGKSRIAISNLASGIYFYTLEGSNFLRNGKLVVE